jgi:predicted phage terminase large subunit-like protein
MANSAKDKQFTKELEALRALIQAKAQPFADDKRVQKERIKKGATDMEFFGTTYFPHYMECPTSSLHHYFCKRYPEMIFRARDTGQGDREADAAPRGNAKSTWTTLILPIWAMAYKYRWFILIVSETVAQSNDFIQFIMTELETNERLKQDFPDLCGEGPVWRTGTIVTRNGIKVRGAGAGQKLRGMRHGSKRPDLVIGDDLENDEQVESPEQRTKFETWFFRALMKIGQPDTVYIVVGTILHHASLLANLLRKAGWKGQKFKAVLKFSESRLWETWQEVFADVTVSKELAEEHADDFFTQRRDEMLAGTEVLWPEREPYYYLMKMMVSEGRANFFSEKQNEPINPEDCLFQESDIAYWDDDDVDLAGCPHAGVVDPSMGKKSKRNDPSAIVCGKPKGGRIYLTIADIQKRHPDTIIADILLYHERDPFQQFGVESIQFQEFFKDRLIKEAHQKNLTLNVIELRPNVDKNLRIQTLQPYIKNGWVVFRRNMQGLITQLLQWPMGDHDDGPDALEQLVKMIEAGLTKAASSSSEPGHNDYHAERKSGIGGLTRRIFGRRAA